MVSPLCLKAALRELPRGVQDKAQGLGSAKGRLPAGAWTSGAPWQAFRTHYSSAQDRDPVHTASGLSCPTGWVLGSQGGWTGQGSALRPLSLICTSSGLVHFSETLKKQPVMVLAAELLPLKLLRSSPNPIPQDAAV